MERALAPPGTRELWWLALAARNSAAADGMGQCLGSVCRPPRQNAAAAGSAAASGSGPAGAATDQAAENENKEDVVARVIR
eukprot:g70627.t1